MRIVHLLVIAAMVFAAAYVYRIKMDSTSRTERVLRLHAEIREQRDAIARAARRVGQAGCAAATTGSRRPPSAPQADERHAIRLPEEFAGASAEFRASPAIPIPIGAMIQTIDAAVDAGSVTGSVPAEGDHTMTRCRARSRGGSGWSAACFMAAMSTAAAKARARVGFAMLAFAAIFAVIGGRLIMFAIGGDSHGARRSSGAGRHRHRAAGYRRPQRRDTRHRRQSAEPVRRTAPDYRKR